MSDWLDAEGHADRAFEMYERGRWAEAESELRKALSLNPGQAEWHFNLGLTLEACGRDREALASYERAIELMPEQIDPLLAAGSLAGRLENYERAISFFNAVLRFDPVNEAAYASKIDAHTQIGDHDEAETTFYMSQHALPEPSAQCLAAIAESLIEREEYARAGWCLREAMRTEPHMPRLMARLGAVYAAVGRPQRAVQLYLRDLREDPGNIDTLMEFGDLLQDMGRIPEAAEKFRRVLELEPANVDAHVALGELAMRCKRYEQARMEFELVLKLDPMYDQIRMRLGEALLRLGRLDQAMRFLREEYERLPWAAPAGVECDPLRLTEKDDDEIVDDWSADELGRFGELLLQAQLPTEASRVFERAIADAELDNPQRVHLLRQFALAKFRSGDREAGTIASRRVLRLDPRCVPSIHNLALAALEEGRLRAAAGWIKRGRAIDKHDDGLGRLRVRLWIAAVKRALRLRF